MNGKFSYAPPSLSRFFRISFDISPHLPYGCYTMMQTTDIPNFRRKKNDRLLPFWPIYAKMIKVNILDLLK